MQLLVVFAALMFTLRFYCDTLFVCERNIAGTGAIKIADFFCTFCAIKDAIFTVRQ